MQIVQELTTTFITSDIIPIFYLIFHTKIEETYKLNLTLQDAHLE